MPFVLSFANWQVDAKNIRFLQPLYGHFRKKPLAETHDDVLIAASAKWHAGGTTK